MAKSPARSLEERNFDEHAPNAPIDGKVFDLASRAVFNLRREIDAASKLLHSRTSGAPIEINGVTVNCGNLVMRQIFGLIWPGVLERLKYWEFFAERYVALDDSTKRNLQMVRLQIDELMNA